MRYSLVEEKKETGAHYTPKLLADFVAEKIVSALPQSFSQERIRIIDPAAGDGELLYSLLEVLEQRDYFDFEVHGFDTATDAIKVARDRILNSFPDITLSLKNADFLEFAAKRQQQMSLFENNKFERFDVVIANPPYVRTQIMGAGKSQELAKQFSLSGRIDLYQVFIQGIAQILKPGGIAGIIVSNRFLSTKSGASVRHSILNEFDVLHIWDMGDTRLFEAAVLPAVLLLKKKNGDSLSPKSYFTSIYTSSNGGDIQKTENAITALDKDGVVKTTNGDFFRVQQGVLEYGDNSKNVWRIANQESEKWLKTVKSNTFYKFGDVGKIRVGVKTTADKVFIRNDWTEFQDSEKPELLRHLTTHHIAERYKAKHPTKEKKIVYPHEVIQGQRAPVDLNKFPRTAQYLELHRDSLESRDYLKGAGRRWYEIWVPQDPNAWKQPKVVFRDIVEKPTFWMDTSGSVVNGDCYWIICKKSQQAELLWLILAVGNSTFIEKFYDYRFHNKLYAGRRRFITQYVKEFPLPDPETELALRIIETAKEIYDLLPAGETDELEDQLDRMVWQAFGFNQRSL
jgi:adenine-specific DNA-methyltransferase